MNDTNKIRTFIAIDLPVDIQLKLDKVINLLKNKDSLPVRWVAAKNIHLTLKFLGEVENVRIDAITQVILAECQQAIPFEVSIEGIGSFPNSSQPRVIWTGVNAPQGLSTLAGSIDRSSQQLGFPAEERAFNPHLTLGRVLQTASPLEIQAVAKGLSAAKVGTIGSFIVNQVTLYSSVLKPGGSIYTSLFTTRLNRPG